MKYLIVFFIFIFQNYISTNFLNIFIFEFLSYIFLEKYTMIKEDLYPFFILYYSI